MSKRLNLLTAILLIGFVPLMAAIILLSTYSGHKMEKELEDNVYLRLKACASSVAQYFTYDIQEGTLAKDELSYEFIDSLMEDEIVLTFFEGDTRYITSVKDDSGKRAEGTKANAEIWNTVKAGNDYHADKVDIAGHEYYVYYTPVYDETGTVYGMAFAGEREEIVDEVKSNMIRNLYLISAGIVMVFGVLLVFVARLMRNPIVQSVEEIEEIANGNLTRKIHIKSALKEINQLIDAAETLQCKLGEIVGKVNTNAETMGTTVEELSTQVETSTTGVEQINTAMEEIAKTAVSMADNVQGINTQAIEMGTDINDISTDVQALNEITDKMKGANDKANTAVVTVLESSTKSQDAVNKITEQVESTNEAVNEIDNAVALILDITSQTNLLSLNASIEAARAGEAGRGFAVVASEIKKLAEQSAIGAEKIKQVVENILKKSKESVGLAKGIKQIIEEEQINIADAQKSFDMLSNAIEENIMISGNIREKVEQVKEGIIGNINDLSAISQENAASNEEVTATTQDVANAVLSINTGVSEVKKVSEELEELMGYFTV